MGRYRKIEVRMWGDEKFRALSPMPPSGQGLWLFLLTNPYTSPIPGLFSAGEAAMAERLHWTLEAFREAFGEGFRQGMVKADWKAPVVWIPKGIRHNPPESPNVVRSWGGQFDLIPECPLKREALEAIRTNVYSLGEPYRKAFDEAFGNPSGEPPPKPFGESSPKAMPNQEQEQEQKKPSRTAPSKANGAGAPGAIPPQANRNGKLKRERAQPDDVEEIYRLYPRKVGREDALKKITNAIHSVCHVRRCDRPAAVKYLKERTSAFAQSPAGNQGKYTPYPAKWFKRHSYLDDDAEWHRMDEGKGVGSGGRLQRQLAEMGRD